MAQPQELGPDGQPLDRIREYLKCKMSTLYFIENYVSAPVAGGFIHMRDSDLWHSTVKYRQLVTAVDTFDAVNFMASRQHGKTQSILAILLHHLIFFPKLRIEYITLDARRANDAILRMNDIMSQLPEWLQVPKKGKSERVTYLELENNSRISASYVSGSVDPDKLGRGMSSPIIYIDETAFIPKMEVVWAAMQPAISAARVFAKQNNYPTCIIFSTTPNGAGGNYFYNIWKNAFDSSELFEGDTIKIKDNWREILESDQNRNTFVNIKIHWSETNKDEKWYNQQVRELNFNMRKVNQEINLAFLGSTNTVFSDEVLQEFVPAEAINEVNMAMGETFKLFSLPDPNRRYLMGVDVAASTAAKADFSAIVLIDAQTGVQVGEWNGKFSVVKRFAAVVKSLTRGLNSLFGLTEDSLTVIIERNSFGLGVVEEFLYDDTGDLAYGEYLWWTQLKNEKVPGMQTNAGRREDMFNLLLGIMNTNPEVARGRIFQDELRNLEQKSSGRFEAQTGQHDDIIMSYNFCLLVRHEMIKSGQVTTEKDFAKFDLEKINYFMDTSFSTIDILNQSDKTYLDPFNPDNIEVIDHDNKLSTNEYYDSPPDSDMGMYEVL